MTISPKNNYCNIYLVLTSCGGQAVKVPMFQIQVEIDVQVPGSNPRLGLQYRLLRSRNTLSLVMPQAGFDPPGEKWQLCLNIVIALPPKPPRLDYTEQLLHLLIIRSYGHFWLFSLGHLVKNFRPSGFYLFGCLDSAFWTHLLKATLDERLRQLTLLLAVLDVRLGPACPSSQAPIPSQWYCWDFGIRTYINT